MTTAMNAASYIPPYCRIPTAWGAPRSVARGTREAGSGSGADASDRVGDACIPRSGRIPRGVPAPRCAVAISALGGRPARCSCRHAQCS